MVGIEDVKLVNGMPCRTFVIVENIFVDLKQRC